MKSRGCTKAYTVGDLETDLAEHEPKGHLFRYRDSSIDCHAAISVRNVGLEV